MVKTYQEQKSDRPNREARSVLGSGVLLAVDSGTSRVVAATANAHEVLGPQTVLGQSLGQVFPADAARSLRTLTHRRDASPRPSLVNAAFASHSGELYELYLYSSGPTFLLELLRPSGPPTAAAWSSEMAQAREKMMRASSIAEAAEPIIAIIPRWTGFDRAAVLELTPTGKLERLSGAPSIGPERLCPELNRYLSTGRSRSLVDRDLEPSQVQFAESEFELDLGRTELQPLFPSERESDLPRSRWLLPVRVGGRLWGVVAAESPGAPVCVRHSLRIMLAALVDGLGSRLWVHTRGVGTKRGASASTLPGPSASPSSTKSDVASHLYDLDVHLRRLSTSLAHTFVLRAESAEPLPDLSGPASRIDELSELLAVARSPLALVRTELGELVEEASRDLSAPIRISAPTNARTLVHVHRRAVAALLRAASRRLGRSPGGWGVSLESGGPSRRFRLVVRTLEPASKVGSGVPLETRVEFLDAIARVWGGGVSCVASPREVHIDLGPSAVRD